MTRSSSESTPTRLSEKCSDSELWSAVQSGDAYGWELLVRRYGALVNTIAIRAGLSMSEAADCFQQTWLLLYQHRMKITTPERLCAWITTTAKRESLRLMRGSRRYVGLDEARHATDAGPLPDEILDAMQRHARLEAAMQRLDPRCARLIAALFLDPEAKSYEQIAADLGIPKNSMGPVRRRCLDKLHRLVREEGWSEHGT